MEIDESLKKRPKMVLLLSLNMQIIGKALKEDMTKIIYKSVKELVNRKKEFRLHKG